MQFIGPDAEAPTDGLYVRLNPSKTAAYGFPWEQGTKDAIALLERMVQAGSLVCDIGTGTGILALTAWALGAKVVAYEQDPTAREVARANFELNAAAIELREEYDYTAGFDLVVANLGDVNYGEMGVLKAGKAVYTSG